MKVIRTFNEQPVKIPHFKSTVTPFFYCIFIMFIPWMFITLSFKKSLIVEQFQGNYLNLRSGVPIFFAAGRNAWYNYLTIRLPPPNYVGDAISRLEWAKQNYRKSLYGRELHKARKAWIYMQCCRVRPSKIRFILKNTSSGFVRNE